MIKKGHRSYEVLSFLVLEYPRHDFGIQTKNKDRDHLKLSRLCLFHKVSSQDAKETNQDHKQQGEATGAAFAYFFSHHFLFNGR